MKYSINLIGLLFNLLLSCRKHPGDGGISIIKGKLFGKNINNRNAPVTSDDAEADYDVYILYGDNTTPSDRVRTAPDGSYEFRHLRKGTYTIYVYSLDTTNVLSTREISIQKKIEIKSRKEEITAENLVVYQAPDKNGTCSIKGRVFARNLNSSFSYVQNSGYMPDLDVYISYSGSEGYDERVVTDSNGYFIFKGLRKGKYKIYVFCKVPVYPTNLEPRTSLTGYVETSIVVDCNQNNREFITDDLKVNI